MSKRQILNKTHAQVIAGKLGAVLEEGRAHTLAVLYENEVRVAAFGIRHGSKKDQGHDHIPKSIHFPSAKCLRLAQCTLNRPDWIKALHEQGLISKPPQIEP